MPRPPDALPGWLLAELDPVVGLAARLTDTAGQATELVAEALAREPSWTELPAGHDPVPMLRAGVVRTYLRGGGEPVRAAVVLRERERLTIGEIATLVDRPPKRVLADLSGGSPPGPVDDRGGVAPSKAAVAEQYAAVVPQIRRESGHRRRLVGVGLLVGALVVTGAVAGPTLAVRLLPPDLREPGEWRFSHRVALADGWSIEQRLLTADEERTVVQLPTTNGDPGSCTVTLTGRLDPVPPDAETHPVRVAGHDATYVDDPRTDPAVVWFPDDDHAVVVGCSRLVTAESLHLQVADAVVFDREPMGVPFTLTDRPEGYRIAMVSWFGPAGADVAVELTPDDVVAAPSVLVTRGLPEPADRCLLADGAARSAVTVVPRDDEICLRASWSTDGTTVAGRSTQRALDEISGLLRSAPDPADPSTWFAADDLPR